MEKLVVSPSKLMSAANKLDSYAKEIEAKIKAIQDESIALKKSWDGIDYKSFLSTTDQYLTELSKIVTNINKFSNALKESSSTYTTLNNNILDLLKEIR